MSGAAVSGQIVWLLYVERSDQHGTSEVAGVFASAAAADSASRAFRDRRTFIKPRTLGAIEAKPR